MRLPDLSRKSPRRVFFIYVRKGSFFKKKKEGLKNGYICFSGTRFADGSGRSLK